MKNKFVEIIFLQFLVFTVAQASDSKESHLPADDAKKIVIKDIGSEIYMPSKLFDKIQEEPKSLVDKSHDKEEKPKTGFESAMSEVSSVKTDQLSFAPIRIIMTEKNPGVLIDKKIVIELPVGGGEIDLGQLTTGVAGTFFVQFQFEKGDDEASTELHYLSTAKKRKIDGEIWGTGCGKILNLTSFNRSQIESGKFAVNTRDNRHLTVLGGSFVFSARLKREIKTAQVTFVASSLPQYFCEPLKTDTEKK